MKAEESSFEGLRDLLATEAVKKGLLAHQMVNKSTNSSKYSQAKDFLVRKSDDSNIVRVFRVFLCYKNIIINKVAELFGLDTGNATENA